MPQGTMCKMKVEMEFRIIFVLPDSYEDPDIRIENLLYTSLYCHLDHYMRGHKLPLR